MDIGWIIGIIVGIAGIIIGIRIADKQRREAKSKGDIATSFLHGHKGANLPKQVVDQINDTLERLK